MLPFAWNKTDFFKGRKLKVAVLWHNGAVKPHPPITRALKQVVDKLKRRDNFEVVEWKPCKHDLAWEMIVCLFFQRSSDFTTADLKTGKHFISPMARREKLLPSNLVKSPGVLY